MINSKYFAFYSFGFSLFIASASAYSQAVTVPNTFSSGSPAKAAEVNANFTTLANAINNLASQLSAQVQNSSSVSTCQLGKNNLGLVYAPTNDLPNKILLANSSKVAAVPVIDLVNGARYSLIYPASSYRDSAWSTGANVTRSSGSMESQCGNNLTINGYKAFLTTTDSYDFYSSNEGTSYYGTGAIGRAYANLTIFYGGSQVTVNFEVKIVYSQISDASSKPVYALKEIDYVLNFPWSKVTPLPSTLASQLQTLVNAVSFKAIP